MEKASKIQLGVWKNKEQFEILCFDPQDRIVYFVLPKMDFAQIAQQILAYYPNRFMKLCPVCAVFPHQFWQKSVILPQHLSLQEAENQCRFLLAQALPIPLPELWFDYCYVPLKQGSRLDIFAIQRSTAHQYVQTFLPLKVEILDTVVHALLRAFHYVMDRPLQRGELFLYQDEQGCLAIQEQGQQTLVLQQSQGNLVPLYQQFCQQYEQVPAQVYVYRRFTSTSKAPLPAKWEEIQSQYPFIPLGNALWQRHGDNENSLATLKRKTG
ncbi:competence protein ComA [Pasteurella sp. PK-2025]|uniref:competence protein ComA n=1 Tax=Pasteurella sp. PK-2025 TaxID=3413133 RepID=UPI003C7776AC